MGPFSFYNKKRIEQGGGFRYYDKQQKGVAGL